MPSYRTGRKRFITTPDTPLGSGGEADVYAVNRRPSLVAKIYTRDVPSGPTPTALWERKEQKLAAMIKKPLPSRDADDRLALARPLDILYYPVGNKNGLMAGFTMPKLDLSNYDEVVHYYHPQKRNELIEKRGLDNLQERANLEELLNGIVRNILTILGNIHDLDLVIGDINESNILVHPNSWIAFVDSDSFQVQDPDTATIYRCPVGKDEYSSPRLLALLGEPCTDPGCPSGETAGHTMKYGCVNRTVDDDYFAVAVLLFKLLVNGRHPFASIGSSQTFKEQIINHEFPYGRGSSFKLSPPQGAEENWNRLSREWKNYFGYTFVNDRRYKPQAVLDLGDPFGGASQPHLGRQVTVNNTPAHNGSGNGSGTSGNSTPAAHQRQTPPAPAQQRQTASASEAKQSGQQTPRGPRNRQPRPQPTAAAPRNQQAQPAVQLVSCPRCGMDNPISKIVCQNPACLAFLHGAARPCASCQTLNPVKAKFCGGCGQAQP